MRARLKNILMQNAAKVKQYLYVDNETHVRYTREELEKEFTSYKRFSFDERTFNEWLTEAMKERWFTKVAVN